MESAPLQADASEQGPELAESALTGTVDVSSTLVNIGRAFDVGTGSRSMALSRVTMHGQDEGSLELALSDSTRRYEYLRLLGRGGMGQVDQVWDQDLMRKLAIKRLRPERTANPGSIRQFLWEARVTAYLDHPNIVPVHDLGIDENGNLYFTMKFVHGTSLDEVLSALARLQAATQTGRKPGPVDDIISAEHRTQTRRVRLFLDICQAIAYAHERGVLHRDLKPANVMLGPYGEVVIMDWGLAYPLPGPNGEGLRELLPDALPEHRPNRTSGTPRYMSPEQVSGQPLDERSDIYSLGIILYELLTLRSPYSATEFTHLMVQVTEGDVIPLTETGAGVPDALAGVVNRAMARAPEQRYATVRELADDIETVLDGFTPSPAFSSVSMVMPVVAKVDLRGPAPSEGAASEAAAERGSQPGADRRRPSLLLTGAAACGGMALMAAVSMITGGAGWLPAVGLAVLAGALAAAGRRG